MPTEVCDQHVQVRINIQNNKIATDNTPADLIQVKVFLKSQAPTILDDTMPPPPPPVTPPPVITTPPATDPIVPPIDPKEKDKEKH